MFLAKACEFLRARRFLGTTLPLLLLLHVLADDGLQLTIYEGFREVEVVGVHEPFHDRVLIHIFDLSLQPLLHPLSQFVFDFLERGVRTTIFGKFIVQGRQFLFLDGFDRQRKHDGLTGNARVGVAGWVRLGNFERVAFFLTPDMRIDFQAQDRRV